MDVKEKYAYIFVVINFFGWLTAYADELVSLTFFQLAAGIPVLIWLYWMIFRHQDEFLDDLFLHTGIDVRHMLQR